MKPFIPQESAPVFDLPKLGQLLTIDDFAPHVGKTFQVEATPRPVGLVLEEITSAQGEAWMERQPFVLVFSTPWAALLVEGVYPIRPEATAAPLELYLIPTHTPPGLRRLYHAVVN